MKIYTNKNTNDLLTDIKNTQPVLWINPNKTVAPEALGKIGLSFEDILDAEERLKRFAPLIAKLFPETCYSNCDGIYDGNCDVIYDGIYDGIIESPIVKAPEMKKQLENLYGTVINGDVYLKCDNYLKIAGSIKARGGIYEVLKFAEELALRNNLLSIDDNYCILMEDKAKKLFSQYTIAVGSTGNLGMSIGIMSAALGFKVTVHMSHDAKEWKKERLKALGVNVVEHADDYTIAVEAGRQESAEDPYTYFIDDENSKHLFLGYSVAALRLQKQLEEEGLHVSKERPLYVYLPCGVGGGPGGITFGLKHIYGDDVHCYFAEPTHSPCMLLGLITQKYGEIHVNQYGIDNITEADGLAVGSPSKFVSRIIEGLIDGIYTLEDKDMFKLLALLKDAENIKIEPSAASSLLGPVIVNHEKVNKLNAEKSRDNAIHLCWLTGGLLLPDHIYNEMYNKGRYIIENIIK